MKVELRLFATLRKHLPEDHDGPTSTLELSHNARVVDVLIRLKIPKETAVVVLVNGKSGGEHVSLSNGDILSIFPPVGGG